MGGQTVKSGTKPKKGKICPSEFTSSIHGVNGQSILGGKAAPLTERHGLPEVSVLNTENKYISGRDVKTNLILWCTYNHIRTSAVWSLAHHSRAQVFML